MKHAMKFLSLVLVLILALGCTAFADEKHSMEYLGEFYGVAEFEETVSAEAFNAALAELNQPAIEAETLTVADAVVAAIRLADMEKLALSYIHDDVPEKAAEVLAEYEVEADEAHAPYVACALDLDLVDAEDMAAETVSGEFAAELLYDAAEMAGMGRRYIGRISDDNIRTALRTTLESFVIFDNETLSNLGKELVLRGASTGYGLKYSGYDAHFMPEYTLKYGHSSFNHAVQLISLMESEGFDAYIQVEPKISVFEYLPEWGAPGAPTPTYAVKQVSEERYLTSSVEYDMMIEFDTVEDKEAFHNLIETYAKKYDESYDADGNMTEKLIAGAWWQPLYSSLTPMENEEFGDLVDNVIYDETGMYSIHPFSLPEDTAGIEAVVAEVAPELKVSVVPFEVNPAFYRYITGESHQ